MDFILNPNNLLLLAVIVLSAVSLALPAIRGRGVGGVIQAQALVKLINEKKAQVIDLRGPSEFKRGHIAKSRNIPANELANVVNSLDKTRPVVLVDEAGGVVRPVSKLFKGVGFQELYFLEGGISGWKKENLPLV